MFLLATSTLARYFCHGGGFVTSPFCKISPFVLTQFHNATAPLFIAERHILRKKNFNLSKNDTSVTTFSVTNGKKILSQGLFLSEVLHLVGGSRLASARNENVTHSECFGVKLITLPVNYVTFICTLHLARNLGWNFARALSLKSWL